MPEAVFDFLDFWQSAHGRLPRELVFDSRLITYKDLGRLDKMGVAFITLRRRSPRILREIAELPASAWRRVELDLPTRKYKTPRVYEQAVSLEGSSFRQLYLLDSATTSPPSCLPTSATPPPPS